MNCRHKTPIDSQRIRCTSNYVFPFHKDGSPVIRPAWLCDVCGYKDRPNRDVSEVPDQFFTTMWDNHSKHKTMPHQGFGDTVEFVLRKTGIKYLYYWIRRKFGKPKPSGCGGCAARQAALNRKFPSK